jgi:4-hydroxybenzoate polyprenyltransferase
MTGSTRRLMHIIARRAKPPCVAKDMSVSNIILEYIALAALALCIAAATVPLVLYATIAPLVSGLIYNVPPLRLKDVALFDVLSESINNPIRLIFGWAMVDPTTLPPASILVAYWLGGAFLMNTKRLAEFRDVGGQTSGDMYRRPFRQYSERRLTFLSVLYAQLSIACLVIFIVKYRIEYILALPLVATLFCIYFYIGLKPQSVAQAPEKLFTTYLDLPFLQPLLNVHFLRISW